MYPAFNELRESEPSPSKSLDYPIQLRLPYWPTGGTAIKGGIPVGSVGTSRELFHGRVGWAGLALPRGRPAMVHEVGMRTEPPVVYRTYCACMNETPPHAALQEEGDSGKRTPAERWPLSIWNSGPGVSTNCIAGNGLDEGLFRCEGGAVGRHARSRLAASADIRQLLKTTEGPVFARRDTTVCSTGSCAVEVEAVPLGRRGLGLTCSLSCWPLRDGVGRSSSSPLDPMPTETRRGPNSALTVQ